MVIEGEEGRGRKKKGGLRCVSVAPELFHHQRVVGEDGSMIEALNRADEEEEEEEEKEEAERELMSREGVKGAAEPANGGRRFITLNIMYSARCNADKNDDELVDCMPTDEELDRYTT